MRIVFGLILVLGIGLAGGAVYLTSNLFKQYEAKLEAERANNKPVIETIDVYVATKKLEYGQRLMKDSVELVAYPAKSLPEGYFDTEAALFPEGEDEPRTILRTMEHREIILQVKVTGPGEEAGITSQLERGMRAFAINVDVSSGVSGFLRPGDRVDVYWSGDMTSRTGNGRERTEVTKLIESGVRLIAVDQVSNVDTTGAMIARTVTVSVRPEQVAALAQAQSTGTLSLSLVGADDDTTVEKIEIDQNELLGIAEYEPEPERAEEPTCTVRTRRAGEVVFDPIPCADNS
ncbi:MAG: Flp pilus assembly protein CpaB [Pseudomonadota bacterium]